MFDWKHYVPILRWKAAEKEALEKLSKKEKEFITPLIEIVMPNVQYYEKDGRLKTINELIEQSRTKLQGIFPKIPEEVLRYYGEKPAFIDLNLIADLSLRKEGYSRILATVSKLSVFLIPVTYLNSTKEVQTTIVSFARKNKSGLCLRLISSDFADEVALSKRIKGFLTEHNFSEKDIDLLVDFKKEQSLRFESLCQKIPSLLKWRTFSFASGAFPMDLNDFDPGLHPIPRSDWKNWVSQASSNTLIRKPSFADYTIQHPIYKEPPRGDNPSASIRYALKDRWLIMRGQALRSQKSAGHAQYPAQAKLLSQLPEFFGASFSYGDAYIEKKGIDINTKETGTPRTWIRAGINHHLACTIDQIANLP